MSSRSTTRRYASAQLARLARPSAPAATRPRWKLYWKIIYQCAVSGEGNLLALAVEATRRRATVGEISFAMET